MLKRYIMLRAFTLLLLALICQLSYAQNVGINSTGAAPDASAGLDVSFTNKGFLAPRMTSAQKNAISNPATGLLVYQTDAPAGFYYNSGTPGSPVWVYNGSSSQWTTSGSDIYYLNKVGIGTSSTLNYALTVGATTNPLFLSGVQEGSGLDSILLIVNGVVKKRVYTATASTNAWSLTGNPAQTSTFNSGSYIGTSDNNPLRFRTNNTQRMHIDVNGNVAIGANPTFASNAEKFLVDAGTTSSYNLMSAKGSKDSYLQVNIQNTSNTTSASSDIVASNASATDANDNYYIDMGINSNNYTLNTNPILNGFSTAYLYNKGGDLAVGPATSGKVLKLFTGGTATSNERMRIQATGNIGIGSTTNTDEEDDAKVEIVANEDQYTGLSLIGDTDNYFELNVQNEGDVNNGDSSTDIVATANNGTATSNYINMGINSEHYRTNGGGTGRILNGPNKTYVYGAGAEMYIGNAAADEPLIFFTNSGSVPDEDARGTERMRITDDGEVCIGVTSPYTYNWGFSTYKLSVAGSIKVSGVVDDSDRRLKTNIQSLNYGLKDILSLQPVKYKWIDPSKSTQTQLGLIAQDAKEIIPEVVYGEESKESLGINYTQIIPVLINAIKEQQQQIEELKKSDANNQLLIQKLLEKK